MNNLDRFYDPDPQIFARSYFSYLERIFSKIDHSQISLLVAELLSVRDRGGSIFFIGNGGSASTASHFANDITIGSRSFEKPFKAISLTDNQAILTAIGNDYGYEEVFVHQLKAYASGGDLLVAISASGNSPNLIKSIEYANSSSISTFSITAFDGGKLKTLATNNIHIPTELKEYGPAEDLHMIIAGLVGSYLIRYVRSELSKNELKIDNH